MGSILYIKNNQFINPELMINKYKLLFNKLFINVLLIILIYLYYLIDNTYIFASEDLNNINSNDSNNSVYINNKSTKYYTLNVNFNIIISKQYEHQITDLKQLITNIKDELLIYKASLETKLTIHRIKNLHYRAIEEITNSLQSFGYYEINIIDNNLTNVSKRAWQANYTIEIGPAIKLKKIDIDILGEVNKSQITNIKKQINKYLKINANLAHENYEKSKQFILNKLHEYGFLNAQTKEAKILIDLQKNTAHIIIIIDAKQQYYFGKVTFKSELYSDGFLNKYIPFKKHDCYSVDNLMQLKNNLLNSGLFSKVRIDTFDIKNLSTNDANLVPIIVRVYNKPKHKYFGSIGFGTDTGFRGSFGYVYRLQNLPGNAINLNTSISKKRKQTMLDYSFLGKNPITQKYNLGLILQKEKFKERSNKNLEFYFQKLIEKNNLSQTWKLSLIKEHFKELPTTSKKKITMLLPTIKFTWLNLTKANLIEENITEQNSKYGNKLIFTTKFGIQPLISSANLFQFIINEKFIKPFIYNSKIIFKSTIGSTFIKDFNKLPLSLRFFTGGDYTIRGFGYNYLGPLSRDLNNNVGVIGGKHLFIASIELEKPIPKYPQVAVACFIDGGNAVNNFNNFINTKLAIGTGIGISYATPIGALKIYIAKPVKNPKSLEFTYKKHLRIHLNFTTDF